MLRDGWAVDGPFFFFFFPFWFQADTQHFYSDLRIRDDLSVCLRLCFCRIELAQSVLAYPSLWVHSGGVLMMMMMTMVSANKGMSFMFVSSVPVFLIVQLSDVALCNIPV